MNLFRVYGDEQGETHLERLDLPAVDGAPRRIGLQDVPTSTLTISQLLETKPDNGLHTPPRRQLVVVLRGELEITTTGGDQQRLCSGDCLFADDLNSKGHFTRQIGGEALSTLTIGLPEDWRAPGT